MRTLIFSLFIALTLLHGIKVTFAQNVSNGQRLSERWCSECHMIGTTPGKYKRAKSFAAIAAKNAITSDRIASFLLLPHATMPNLPLTRADAQDIAAFIISMKD
jgi:mono/diheme cytochrome c family protein